MDLTGKQKRYLRSLGVTMDPILTIGKEGVSQNTIIQAEGVLLSRELIKCRVLNTSPEEPSRTATAIAEATGANLVQVLGRTFLLYKPHPEERTILLP